MLRYITVIHEFSVFIFEAVHGVCVFLVDSHTPRQEQEQKKWNDVNCTWKWSIKHIRHSTIWVFKNCSLPMTHGGLEAPEPLDQTVSPVYGLFTYSHLRYSNTTAWNPHWGGDNVPPYSHSRTLNVCCTHTLHTCSPLLCSSLSLCLYFHPPIHTYSCILSLSFSC